jgi:hypothetical protein
VSAYLFGQLWLAFAKLCEWFAGSDARENRLIAARLEALCDADLRTKQKAIEREIAETDAREWKAEQREILASEAPEILEEWDYWLENAWRLEVYKQYFPELLP